MHTQSSDKQELCQCVKTANMHKLVHQDVSQSCFIRPVDCLGKQYYRTKNSIGQRGGYPVRLPDFYLSPCRMPRLPGLYKFVVRGQRGFVLSAAAQMGDQEKHSAGNHTD
ncbi:hypothetical protein D3C78_1063080 [compost metagenome]